MNRRRYKDDAVSPVIAVILLVAITVVLIGVLFLWVQTIISTDKTSTPTITGYVEIGMDEYGEEYYYITIESVSGGNDPFISTVEWSVLDSGGATRATGRTDDVFVYGNTTLYPVDNSRHVGFGDQPGDGMVNQNDFFVIRSASLDNANQGIAERGGSLVLLYGPTGDQMAKIVF